MNVIECPNAFDVKILLCTSIYMLSYLPDFDGFTRVAVSQLRQQNT